MKKLLSLALAAALILACASVTGMAEEKRVIRYMTSKAPTDDVLTTIKEVADKYNAEGGNIELVIETSADRATYDQKIRTMVAGNMMPDMFEIDATPYCEELVAAGLLVDMEAFLKEAGSYDQYIPLALDYQRLSDGRIFMIPLEYTTEMIWYNVDMFEKYGLTAPATFDEWLKACAVLKENGITPISIDGIDGWPLMRYVAQPPFRRSGNDFLYNLSTGAAKMSDPIGVEAAEFIQEIGQYFQVGFSSTDYATAQNLFLDGKAAMYEIGTWELNKFLAKNLPEGLNVDYFYMPMLDGAVTQANDYWAFGGIGLACAQQSFDEPMKAFLTYLVNEYDAAYLSRQHFPPRKLPADADVSGFDPLFLRVQKDMAEIGDLACKPWDTLLPMDTVSTLNDNLVALAMGQISVEDFVQIMDESLAANVA